MSTAKALKKSCGFFEKANLEILSVINTGIWGNFNRKSSYPGWGCSRFTSHLLVMA
jgi:hypothetical protein